MYNALGVSYKRDNKLDKAIQQFEKAGELQPGYVTAWNNLKNALDPNNKVARPRQYDLRLAKTEKRKKLLFHIFVK